VANLRDIKRRIGSVAKIQQITSAMRMVAAAKLRRAQAATEAARPYAEHMRFTLLEVVGAQTETEHPLLEAHESVRSFGLVVVTSDRGLAGAYSSNILKRADALLAERQGDFEKVSLVLVGRKAVDHYRRRRPREIVDTYESGSVSYAKAAEIARGLTTRFVDGDLDEVALVYSLFISTLNQKPTMVPLLPFAPEAEAGEGGAAPAPYSIEPSAERLLKTLVPKVIEVEVFRALLENQAGEHAARMAAMESATRNTKDLIESLTLVYNRARQAAITKELVEIMSGAEAQA
jgi:F-type H+-transporting ATPase subunit gamma